MSADRVIIERAAAGDPDALEDLLRTVTPWLRQRMTIDGRWARSFDVDDVLQVTFLEAFLRIRSLEARTVDGFRAWIRRIAEHNLVDAIRGLERAKRSGNEPRVTRGAGGESAHTLLLQVAGPESTAGGRAATAEAVERLHAAIGQLPASYREVIAEVDLAERTVAEVAAESGRSVGAVHMLRSRARDRLQELMRAAAE